LNRSESILGNQRGISLLIVLIMVVVLGLAAGVAGSSWKTIVQRSKEAELLFRGDQYRRAIESFYKSAHGGQQGLLPQELDDLLKDPRFPETKRHIRRLYADPMTGKEFEAIRDQAVGNRIKGVRSSSEAVPFKQDGFPAAYEKFAGATSYKTWEFVFERPIVKTPPAGQPGQPGAPGLPGQPGQPVQPGQPGQPADSGQSGQTGQPEQPLPGGETPPGTPGDTTGQ